MSDNIGSLLPTRQLGLPKPRMVRLLAFRISFATGRREATQLVEEIQQECQVRGLSARLIPRQNRREALAVWRQVVDGHAPSIRQASLRPHTRLARGEGIALSVIANGHH